jgi:hypothetical protein
VKIKDGSEGLQVRDVAGGATVGRGQLAFDAAVVRLTAAGGDNSVVLCKRSRNVLGSVPERR